MTWSAKWRLYTMFDTTVQVFTEWANECSLSVLDNGIDLFVYPAIPDNVLHLLRRNFQLHIDEVVLFVRDTSFWNDRNQGAVVTDWGITCLPDNEKMDELVQISWESVHHVEYSGECFYFFFSEDRNNNSAIHVTHFLKETDSEDVVRTNTNILCSIFNEMADSQMEESPDDEIERVENESDNLWNAGKQEEAIQLLFDYRQRTGCELFTDRIAWYFAKNNQIKKALGLLDDAIGRLPDMVWKTILYYRRYSILSILLNEKIKARNDCLYVVRHISADVEYGGKNVLDDATTDFDEYDNFYVEKFLEQPYQERKLLVPVQTYTDLSQKTLAVLDINNMPSAIDFPMGHPVANQLYVGHPYVPSKYIPFENYELEFLEDKIREFCQIAQCLGATEINIECLNSTNSNGQNSRNQRMSGAIDYVWSSASASYESQQSNSFLESIGKSINLHQKFNPKNPPALPGGLVWYPNESSWQRLYNQRMQGGIIEHEERIETRKSQVVENSQLKQVKAEVELLFIDANGSWDQSMDEKFESHENAVLAIHVKFAPLEQLRGGNGNSSEKSLPKANENAVTKAEEEYMEELKECLMESDEISPRERRLLERLRISLGISVAKAQELERELLLTKSITLTREEQDYLDEYKACLEEGGNISPRERRLLEKLRVTYGISLDRAKEIESLSSR